ncbi:MAG: hypothetical protein AB7N80_11330 [Bdellovibrionales bacterium]
MIVCNIDVPNVIAIVDDPKMRSQIESYFKEIDAEGIRLRFFTTGYEFEQKYFAHKRAGKVHPLNQLPGLEDFSYEQMEASLLLPLSEKSPLPHHILRLKCNAKTLKVDSLEPVVDSNMAVFNRFPEDLLKENNPFAHWVQTEWNDHWQKFLKKAATARTQTLMPMKATEKELVWLKIACEKSGADHLIFTFEDVTNTYREGIQNELKRRAAHQEESEELQLLSEIDMVIFKIDCISGKVPKWMDQTWKQLREGGYFPGEKTPRFILLKYEDDGISKLDVLHNRLDDLIYLPLDRLIFLQKMEIILSLPKKITPSYLFSQELGMDIEISKLSKLEKISDLGLAIRNPVRLTEGLLAHFYVTFPGDDHPTDLWGKVIHSDPHPERQHEFLVYFSFFGIRKNDSMSLKRYLAKGARFHTFINSEREDFLFNPDDLFASDDDKRMQQIAVLDLDDTHAAQIKTNLPKDVDQTRVIVESSYSAFVNRYMSAGNTQFAKPPDGATEADLFAPTVTLTIKSESLEMVALQTPPTEEQTYFGHKGVEAFSTPTGWMKPLATVNGNKELIAELVSLALSGHTVNRTLVGSNSSNEGRIFNLVLSATADPTIIKVDLNLPTKEDLQPKTTNEKISSLDLMVVDLALVPGGNISGFIEAVNEQAAKAGLMKHRKRLKFILTCVTEKQLKHRDWAHPDLIGVIVKPAEMRHLSFLVANALGTKHSVYRLNNLGWMPALLPVHVAKDVRLEMLSEFGAAIRHSRPIAPGAILYLRGGIFDNAPNRCLAARFYHCEEHPKEKGQYLCTMIYFGINDGFMKYARRWFRETYAQSKQAEGSG